MTETFRGMRIAVRIDDALLEQARREACRRGETLSALIEEGLRLALAQRARVVLPVCHAGGGVLPGVDLNDSAVLEDVMEGRG
jgi:hypothetical protein